MLIQVITDVPTVLIDYSVLIDLLIDYSVLISNKAYRIIFSKKKQKGINTLMYGLITSLIKLQTLEDLFAKWYVKLKCIKFCRISASFSLPDWPCMFF